MRILEVIDSYPPPLAGGAPLQVQRLSHELVRRGHEVEVVSLAGPRGPRTELDGAVRVHRVAGWSRFLARLYANPEKPFHPTLPDPGLVRVLGRILRDSRPQIVHAHSWLLYSLLPLLPSQETRLVVAVRDYGFICPKGTLVYRGGVCTGPKYAKCVACAREQYGALPSLALTSGLTAMKPWRGRVDRYVANSTFTARAVAELIEPGKGPMEVIPPFVSDEAFHADQGGRPAFVPSEGPYLMFAGALGPHKGLNVLLEAWAGLEPKLPLVLAGIRRPDTPRSFPVGVIVAEEVSNEDVLRAFGHCLAAVVPSIWPEPFGTVVVEAMAVGRPVIASAVGGMADLVVHGTTGILVPPGDAAALRTAMQRLVADPLLCARMGAEGRKRAAAYSANVVVASWERVFREVLAGATPQVGQT
jgi:glycosyltransferase involved in cell wall biosynthesis